nr:hypothetical protein [Deltaproteobacteria bacterium]
ALQTPDGVGDACDPNPTESGDKFTFYAFDRDEPDWDRVSGSWAFSGDLLTYMGGASLSDDVTVARQGPTYTPPYSVEARFKINNLMVSGGFSVTANLDAQNKGVGCMLQRTAGGDELVAYSSMTAARSSVATINLDTKFTAKLSLTTTTATCDIAGDRPDQPGATKMIPLDVVRAGRVGFEAHQLSAHAEYLIVYYK